MNRTLSFLAAAVLSIAAPAAADAATTRYVDDDAPNNPPGCTSPVTPCKTLMTPTGAVSVADPGDTIRIAAGLYHEAVVSNQPNLHFVGAGSDTTIIEPTGGGGEPGMRIQRGGSVERLRTVGGNNVVNAGGSGLIVESTIAGSFDLRLTDIVAIGGTSVGQSPGPGLNFSVGLGSVALTATGSTFRPGATGLGFTGAVFVVGNSGDGSLTFAGSKIEGGTIGNGIATGGGGAPVTLVDSTVSGQIAVTWPLGTLTATRSRLHGSIDGLMVTGAGADHAQAILRDSLVTATTPPPGPLVAAAAVVQATGATASAELSATGSTFVGRGAGADAAVATFKNAGASPATANIGNSIARLEGSTEAAHADLRADRGVITADHSAFTTRGQLNGGAVTAPGGNASVAGDPRLAADFSLLPGSPLIDRGLPGFVLAGERDLAGAARSLDGTGDCVAVPDIGAFERPSICPPNKAPVFSKVSLLRKKFTVKKPRHRGRKRGTRIRFTLSEAAKVKLSFAVKSKGRKVKVRGKTRCVKPTRKNRKRKSCTRYVSKGSFSVNGKAGRNDLAFAGKVGKRRLGPGSYRLTLQATDAGGLKSARRTLTFKILRP